MIEWLVAFLADRLGVNVGLFRLMDYLTFRTVMATLTALLFALFVGHGIIVKLYKRKLRDTGGEFAAIDAAAKKGTPTAGGLIFISGALIGVFLWGRLNSPYLWTVVSAFSYFAVVGYIDDFQKARFKSSLVGLSQLGKTALQLAYIVPYAVFFVSAYNPVPAEHRTAINLPFVKHPVVDLGPTVFVLFAVFCFYSIVNAVNITDGLDGLVAGPSIMCVAVYAIFSYVLGNVILARYLIFPHLPGIGELVVFCGALAGGLFGFLWYNAYPAEVFMGDTGSLALGGALSVLAFQTRQEFLFVIAGGVFVAMIASSLVQDKIGNRIGRRIFLRAPLHHAMTHRGVAEPKVVIRLWIVSIMLFLVAVVSLKLR